jgi:hypothetical protein
MAWIEQTKKGSIKSGGPQYYLQDLSDNSKELLRARGECPVKLWTPYGIIQSGLVAVSSVVGKVGHDRVQRRGAGGTIAHQVAHWFGLRETDIERIDFEDSFDDDSFVVRPSRVKFFDRTNPKNVYPDSNPLTMVPGHRSPFLLEQIRELKDWSSEEFEWVRGQIGSMEEQHTRKRMNVDERDLLRSSGALHRLGVNLGMYHTKEVDCPEATFSFSGLPAYPCPVEIEEESHGFAANHHAKHRKQRIVVLCMEHNDRGVMRGYVDVLELKELSRAMRETA